MSVHQKNNGFADDVKEPDVEKEIQNIFMSTDKKEDNKPCCSWQGSTTRVNLTEEVQPPLADASNESDFVAESSLIPECTNHSQKIVSSIVTQVVNSKPSITVSSSSLITEGLFDNIESIDEPVSNGGPTACLSNPPDIPPRTRREIPIVNFPDASMLRLIHATQSLLGPPPSYSKSLLDRRMNPCTSIQFVAPIPPPSYDGMESDLRYVNYSGFTLGLGSKSWIIYMIVRFCVRNIFNHSDVSKQFTV